MCWLFILLLVIFIVIFDWRAILRLFVIELINNTVAVIFLNFVGKDRLMLIIKVNEILPQIIPNVFLFKILFRIFILHTLHLKVKILQLLTYLLNLLFDFIQFLLLLPLVSLFMVRKVKDWVLLGLSGLGFAFFDDTTELRCT